MQQQLSERWQENLNVHLVKMKQKLLCGPVVAGPAFLEILHALPWNIPVFQAEDAAALPIMRNFMSTCWADEENDLKKPKMFESGTGRRFVQGQQGLYNYL